MQVSKAIYALGLIGFFGLAACGRDTGYLYEEKRVEHQEPMGQTTLRDPYKQFIWQFNCPTSANPLPTPPAAPGELIFAGAGPHEIDRYRLQNTAMKVQGQICPPVDSQRDLVMAFDVSGSTGTTDPADKKNQTCGRLQAFEAVLSTVNWKSTRVGALTFDSSTFGGSSVKANSKGLFDSRDSLVNAITNNGKKKLFDVICQVGSGTEYNSPLKEAAGMLAKGRENTSKEFFFVSDGEPSDGNKAEKTANDLRTTGVRINGKNYPVTIATIFLGNDRNASDYMRDNYASMDMNNQPVHANAVDASKLAAILAKMNSENILAGGILKHGAKDATTVESIDIMPYVKNYLFELPAFYLDPGQIKDNYELTFEYWDSHMNKFSVTGTLNLKK